MPIRDTDLTAKFNDKQDREFDEFLNKGVESSKEALKESDSIKSDGDFVDNLNKEYTANTDPVESVIDETEARDTADHRLNKPSKFKPLGVGDEFNKIQDELDGMDSGDDDPKNKNPNRLYSHKYLKLVNEGDDPDVAADKMAKAWQADLDAIKAQFKKDKDKMGRDKLIVGLLLAAQGFANGMAVRGTGRIPAKVDTSILKEMENSLTDLRDYKQKKAALQLSHAKYILQNRNLKNSIMMRKQDKEEAARVREEENIQKDKDRAERRGRQDFLTTEGKINTEKNKLLAGINKVIGKAGSKGSKIEDVAAVIAANTPMTIDEAKKVATDEGWVWDSKRDASEIMEQLQPKIDEWNKSIVNKYRSSQSQPEPSNDAPKAGPHGYKVKQNGVTFVWDGTKYVKE